MKAMDTLSAKVELHGKVIEVEHSVPKRQSIDAAKDDGSFGRLVNDDHKIANCKMKKLMVNGKPHLCLFAIRDINAGEEITYHYGDGTWPWRDEVAETIPASGELKETEEDRSYSQVVSEPHCKKAKRFPLKTAQQNIHFSDLDEDSDYSVDNDEDEYVPDSVEESSSDASSICEAIPRQRCNKSIKERKTYSIQKPDLPDSSSGLNRKERPGTLTVHAVSKKKNGERVYNKKHYCLYCQKAFSKIARHIEHVHCNEPEVARALILPKRSKERRLKLQHLRNRGNFIHNCEAIESGSGALVPCKQPKDDEVSKKYLHCVNCQGLFLRKSLWRHMKKCALNKKSDKPGKARVQSLCAFYEPIPSGITNGYWKLLNNMNQDDIYYAVKNDSSLMQLGQQFYNRIGSDVEKHEYIRQKLREMGRLLLAAKKNTPLRKIEDFLIPKNFMHVVNAVKLVAGFDNDTHKFKVPSLALKLGHTLSKISSTIECRAMMDGRNDLVENARNFRIIYETRWNELISFAALRTLKETQWNVPQMLPFTEDIKIMHVYLDKKQQEFQNNLVKEPSAKNWALLAKVILAQIILFNRRREGEVSKMLLRTFISRDTSDLHDDVALALSELEKKLCRHFTRIEIRGKRGRKVPILLTPAMQSSMDLLAQKRKECGVTNDNIYMFARPTSSSHFRGSDCIRVFAKECGAKNPQALSSTRLRKHIATVSKVLNLNETELDQLADFLGHDIRVHRQYYRLPEGTLQLAKLSKLLMALEKGRISEFKGKNLEDINIDPNETVDLQIQESADDQSSESETTELVQLESRKSVCEQSPEPERSAEPVQLESRKSVYEKSPEPEGSAGHKVTKKKWHIEEVKAVERHMMDFIRKCRVPGKNACDRCIMAEPSALKARNWTAVKFYVKNRITMLKRRNSS